MEVPDHVEEGWGSRFSCVDAQFSLHASAEACEAGADKSLESNVSRGVDALREFQSFWSSSRLLICQSCVRPSFRSSFPASRNREKENQTATFQHLIPSWSKTPSNARFTGDNAHTKHWSHLSVAVAVAVMARRVCTLASASICAGRNWGEREGED